MAASSEESTSDICTLITENSVESLQNTLTYGDKRLLLWTRLSLENSSWIINASDGVEVWKMELDKEHLNSYKQIAEIHKYETYLTQFREDFECGNMTITQLSNKLVLNVGAALTYDLYEANTNDRKTEMQLMMFRMADDITELTQKLKVSTESLDRLKHAKETDTNVGLSIFDIPQKKPVAVTVKRKQGASLINPGSRNVPSEPPVQVGETDDLETVHISVLGGSTMLDVFRCPNPISCPFPCEMGSRRYHCPLCDNRPQKPGRMRRHFFNMHAGKQVIEHEGYRILRCKLKCIRANGRITDCSHYHCCLCGRVCLRKVHLCCHLQAHALGTVKTEDDIADDVMDASLAEEEREGEEEDDEDGEAVDKSVLDGTSDRATAAQISQIACSVTGDEHSDSIVALAEGTQVVYVQSVHNGETLTVVPVSGPHSESLHIQPQQISTDVTSADHLATSLQVLTSSAVNPITGLGTVTAEVTQDMGAQDSSVIVKHVEVVLDQGERGIAVSQESAVSPEPPTSTADISQHLAAYTEDAGATDDGEDDDKAATGSPQLQYTEHSYTEFTSAIHRDPALSAADVVLAQTVSAASQLPKPSIMHVAHELTNQEHVSVELTNQHQIANELANQGQVSDEELSNQEQSVTVGRFSAVTSALEATCQQLAFSSTPITSSQMHLVGSDTPLQSVATPVRSHLPMQTMTPPVFQSPVFQVPPQSDQPMQRPPGTDAILLLERGTGPRADDHVFSKLFTNSKPPPDEIFQHPSVIPEQGGLDVCRCKNTECDCRLYHCPLCTCLPNKPGRIKEHFKKIHSEDLIIRYQGYQMLRCKMGCCRPSGKRILNSHYHCCLCGCICISKSGVYEHIRTQHSADPSKPGESTPTGASKRRTPGASGPPAKRRAQEQTLKVEHTSQEASPHVQRPVVVQIPSLSTGNQKADSLQSTIEGTGNQPMAIQLPQTFDTTQGGAQGGSQQPLVILLPQHYQGGQGQATGQSQQPIVIVMPQGGGSGGTFAQPVVIPMPQQQS